MSKKGKKTIDELRRDRKVLDKKDMVKVKGGKRGSWWYRRVCGDITPQ
ncbi:MAG: hypothetical protein AAFU67_09460 [Bacteroidota bacterium]